MTAFELYLAPGQENFGLMTALDIEKHLEETGLINRVFSLKDELVKGWVANPSTYPEELKTKRVLLWGSKQICHGDGSDPRDVEFAHLIWYQNRVLERWLWLVGVFSDGSPTLLRQS